MLFGKKITTVRFKKVIRQNITDIAVSFPEAVCDNVVSNDVRITSSLRIDVIILGTNFLFARNGSCQKLRNCVYISKE